MVVVWWKDAVALNVKAGGGINENKSSLSCHFPRLCYFRSYGHFQFAFSHFSLLFVHAVFIHAASNIFSD